MYQHRKLNDPELIDLLAIHTNRLTQIMIHGETYIGEYDVCKRTIELLQSEIISRKCYLMKPALVTGRPNASSSYHH
jgi:hypothetical protein